MFRVPGAPRPPDAESIGQKAAKPASAAAIASHKPDRIHGHGAQGAIVLVEQRDAIGFENRVDLILVVGNQLVERALPILVRMAHAHHDPVLQLRPVLLLHERRDGNGIARLGGVVAGQGTPKQGDVDVALLEVRHHLLRRRIESRVHHQCVRLDLRQEPARGEIGDGGRACDDTDPRRLQPRILKRIETLERPTLFVSRHVSSAVIGVGRLDDVVALGNTEHDVAAMRVQGVADKPGRVGIERVGDALAELFGEQLCDLVFKSLARLVRERQIARICAGAKHVRVDEFDRSVLIVLGPAAAGPDHAGKAGEGERS